jgi:hypothetical protein
MAILAKMKNGIDMPRWLQMENAPAINAAGTLFAADKRNSIWCDNGIYWTQSTANLYRFSGYYNGWQLINSALGLTALAAEGDCYFTPSFGIYGALAAGCTTLKLVSSTALTAGSATPALGLNQLVKTDMQSSYMIRVISTATGKIEHRTITGNTASATPTYYLDEPLTFSPTAGDTYEILSGLLWNVTITTTAAGQTRYYGVANNVVGNAGATGITTATASSGVALDEAYVPFDMQTGEGLIKGTATYDTTYTLFPTGLRCLQASAAAAGTLTGTASGGDYEIPANSYRNFQIRIVQDTVNPTAVGQRRIIASHTGGLTTTPVYTLGSNWTVTPSTSAKYVIENPNLIYFQNATQAAMLVYNFSPYSVNNGTTTITTLAWSATYANSTHSAVIAAGSMAFPSYGIAMHLEGDKTILAPHSYIYFFRGNSATVDRFNISGAANGLWADNITYNNPVSMTVGSCGDIDVTTFDGSYAYIVSGATNIMYQFNVAAPSLVPWASLPAQSGAAAASKRIAILNYSPATPPLTDDAEKLGMIYVQSHLLAPFFRSDIIG